LETNPRRQKFSAGRPMDPTTGSSRDLKSMFKTARPRKIENASQFIRTTKLPAQGDLKTGLNGVTFAERKLGYNEQLRIDSTLPGQGGPKPHIHKFEQVYFSIEGETTLTYGLLTYSLPNCSRAVSSCVRRLKRPRCANRRTCRTRHRRALSLLARWRRVAPGREPSIGSIARAANAPAAATAVAPLSMLRRVMLLASPPSRWIFNRRRLMRAHLPEAS
jgi:hypothetical protein